LAASNNIGEEYCSDQAAVLSYLMQDFNKKTAKEVNTICREKGSKKGIDRVEGRQRVHMFANYRDAFNSQVEKPCAIIGDDQYNQLLNHIEGDLNQISYVDVEARKVMYAKGTQQPRKLTKSEQNACGADIPAEMDGGIKIKDIIKRHDKETKAKIECRGIKHDNACGELSTKKKKDLLHVDKTKNLAAQLKAREGIQPSDVKYIAPKSTEMILSTCL
jgi:hypothetical protein